jgi:DnaJ-class molecular chaperone
MKADENSTPAANPLASKEITLEEYLGRAEHAETYYDFLGVDPKADFAELKQAYFALAKMFHPDRFHSFGGEKFRRIQTAFTELAQAHETLKNPESREVYDYKIRKELAEREKQQTKAAPGERSIQIEQAAEYFDRGFSLLMDSEFEAAIPFLTKAAHLHPKNGRYRAYFGKALSADGNQRHKAEAELQAAVKIDPYNATFRILLVEFFIQHNLVKRAEGELKRLLEVFPGNREALALMESLKK